MMFSHTSTTNLSLHKEMLPYKHTMILLLQVCGKLAGADSPRVYWKYRFPRPSPVLVSHNLWDHEALTCWSNLEDTYVPDTQACCGPWALVGAEPGASAFPGMTAGFLAQPTASPYSSTSGQSVRREFSCTIPKVEWMLIICQAPPDHIFLRCFEH